MITQLIILMQYLWKKLLIILFLNSIFFNQLQATEINNTNLTYFR